MELSGGINRRKKSKNPKACAFITWEKRAISAPDETDAGAMQSPDDALPRTRCVRQRDRPDCRQDDPTPNTNGQLGVPQGQRRSFQVIGRKCSAAEH